MALEILEKLDSKKPKGVDLLFLNAVEQQARSGLWILMPCGI